MTRNDPAIAEALAALRQRAPDPEPSCFVGIYCPAPTCVARESVIEIKIGGNGFPEAEAFRCPLCGGPVLLGEEGVQTFDEHEAQFRREARISVNHERHERDHPEDTGIWTMENLYDDALPA